MLRPNGGMNTPGRCRAHRLKSAMNASKQARYEIRIRRSRASSATRRRAARTAPDTPHASRSATEPNGRLRRAADWLLRLMQARKIRALREHAGLAETSARMRLAESSDERRATSAFNGDRTLAAGTSMMPTMRASSKSLGMMYHRSQAFRRH